MNVFTNQVIAADYEKYYLTETGRRVDEIEKSLVLELLESLPRGKMLELGCGTGHWTDFFIRQGFQVEAADISDAMLEIAKKKNLDALFRKCDSQSLPYADHSFTLVASITMLEFVDDQDKALKEIYRILKPNGWLILGCLNALSEIGKNKQHDEVFRNAKFFTPDELNVKLQLIGQPKLKSGVFLSPAFEIMDGKKNTKGIEPAFMAVAVQKIK